MNINSEWLAAQKFDEKVVIYQSKEFYELVRGGWYVMHREQPQDGPTLAMLIRRKRQVELS